MMKKPATESLLPIDAKLAELERTREGLLASIIELEKSGAIPAEPPDPDTDVSGKAYVLLNGSAFETPPAKNRNPDTDLFLKRNELVVVDAALEIGRKQSLKANAEMADTRAKQRVPEWRKLQRERALTVAKLLELNDKIENLKGEICSRGATPILEADGFTHRLFGPGGSRGTVLNYWPMNYLEACIKAGIVKKGEVK
jgi:hypothetical protein